MKGFVFLKKEFFWLACILLLAFILRVWMIDAPIADWHSWRQVDTAAVTRNFIKEGFNPLMPKFDDYSGISESPVANPLRFRFVEFPVYNIVVFLFYSIFGIAEIYHRLTSVLFSLGSIIFLYFITKKYADMRVAFLAAFSFAILPFNVFFSRSTLPEPTFIFFSLGMIYFVSEWIDEENTKNLFFSYFFTSIAFLIKPWAIFFYLPLIYLVLQKKSIMKKFLIFSFFALLPFVAWRMWILQQPQGIPASSWLMNGDGIRFRPAFWWWIVSERMGREILGATGLVLFSIGVLLKPKNGSYFFHFWLLSIFLYFAVFATGNVRHNYYQLLFVPIASIFFARGFLALFEGQRFFIPRLFTIPLSIALFLMAIYFSYKQVIPFYRINNPAIIEAGKKLDQIASKDAVVIAPYNGDTAFLYQTNRSGWPFVPTSVKDLIADYGVSYYVSTARDQQTAWVSRYFETIEETERFYIYDLTKLKKDFNSLDPEPR